jgi:uncharacterized protein YwqG
MTPNALSRLIAEQKDLRPYEGYLRVVARPSVDIRLGTDTGEIDRSRFGGAPFCPSDFRWPSHERGEYRFLGQVNFADLESGPAALPTKGLLSFFYAHDDEGDIFWGDPGYVRAFYWAELNGFELCRQRGHHVSSKSRSLQLSTGLDLPTAEELRTDWPFPPELIEKIYREIRKLNELCENYLLGYPSFRTLAYDPTPGKDWTSLLTLDSIDDFDWCWHDGDKLMVFIETQKLAALEFDNLKCDAG